VCGVTCENQAACRSRTKDKGFGRVVRVALERNRQLHTPLYEHSQDFGDRSKRRTAIEGFFFRLDHFYGFEHEQWGGLENVTMRITQAMIAMLSTARSWIEAGKREKIRSNFLAA